MNIMDRFLSVVRIRKNQLQLLGAVSLFLASKLRQTRPLEAEKLVLYTDFSVSAEEIVVSVVNKKKRISCLPACSANSFRHVRVRLFTFWNIRSPPTTGIFR